MIASLLYPLLMKLESASVFSQCAGFVPRGIWTRLIGIIDTCGVVGTGNMDTCGVVVTTLDFQAGRRGLKPWSDLYSRS